VKSQYSLFNEIVIFPWRNNISPVNDTFYIILFDIFALESIITNITYTTELIGNRIVGAGASPLASTQTFSSETHW